MEINWKNEDWAYLLGVIQGDGSVNKRSISIFVGYQDAEYATKIIEIWQKLGFTPKIYNPKNVIRIDVNNLELTSQLKNYKCNGIWTLPENLNFSHWLAGIFDTDGYVTLVTQKRLVGITLKRSGNLQLVAAALAALGVPDVKVNNSTSKFQGKEYLIEILHLSSFSRILAFNSVVQLRHPRKITRLKDTIFYIDKVQSKIPLWRQVAEFCKEARTWKDIAQQFNLTKDQVDSVMGNIKALMEVEIIRSPKMLTRYHVKNQS